MFCSDDFTAISVRMLCLVMFHCCVMFPMMRRTMVIPINTRPQRFFRHKVLPFAEEEECEKSGEREDCIHDIQVLPGLGLYLDGNHPGAGVVAIGDLGVRGIRLDDDAALRAESCIEERKRRGDLSDIADLDVVC
jgi:hypothetical protein